MTLDNLNFVSLVDQTCASSAARPALFHGERTVSYGELARLIDGWAATLAAQGAGPGACVALWLPNSPALVAAFLATLRLGAVAAPLGVLLTGREVRLRLDVARANVLVTTPALRESLGTLGIPVLASATAGVQPGDAARRPPVARGASDVAVLISTSGTTGQPKAAELTHGGITWNATSLAQGLALDQHDVLLAVAPLSHVLGMSGLMNASLISGAALALMERFDAAEALALMARTATTGVLGAPSMFTALVREARRAGLTHRLRFAMSGGSPLPASVSRDFAERFGCAPTDGYGMSEVGGGITLVPRTTAPKPQSVGPALPGSELRIVDLATGTPVPAGTRGEVSVRSPSVMRRYRDDDEATRAVLGSDGWLLTGDIGFLDPDGDLFLVDRKKEIVIRSGYNVYPREVEEVLLAYPGVLEAAVVGVPDDELGEEVVALVVPARDAALDPDAVKLFARERLAAYKYPRRILLVAELPKGPTGKIAKRQIDRQALLARAKATDGAKATKSAGGPG